MDFPDIKLIKISFSLLNKELIKILDEKRAERNTYSKQKPDPSQLEKLQTLKHEIDQLELSLKEVETE